MFHRFQPTDHPFHAGSDLFVLMQQQRALACERPMALAQGTVLFVQLLNGCGQIFNALAEPGEFQVERCFCCFAHGQDYRASLFARSMRSVGGLLGHNTAGMYTASYAEIQRVLIEERSMSEAAEAHGTLAGSLCTAVTYRFEDWLLEILPEGRAQADAAAAALREVYARTAQSLVEADLAFVLFLPEEEQPIDARTEALAQWCQGFLYGLGSRVIQDASRLPGDVGEVVRDLNEITRVGADGSGDLESNESAYTELVEFVRVGVQLVFAELEPVRGHSSVVDGLLH